MLLVFISACTIDKEFDETTLGDEESLLAGGYLSSFGYDKAGKRDKKRDKFGALEDEGANAPSASDRYAAKQSKYYVKYGLR